MAPLAPISPPDFDHHSTVNCLSGQWSPIPPWGGGGNKVTGHSALQSDRPKKSWKVDPPIAKQLSEPDLGSFSLWLSTPAIPSSVAPKTGAGKWPVFWKGGGGNRYAGLG